MSRLLVIKLLLVLVGLATTAVGILMHQEKVEADRQAAIQKSSDDYNKRLDKALRQTSAGLASPPKNMRIP